MADTFRKVYTDLTDTQKDAVAAIKDAAEKVETEFNNAVSREKRNDASRLIAIAHTHLENAIMWAVKAVTTSQDTNAAKTESTDTANQPSDQNQNQDAAKTDENAGATPAEGEANQQASHQVNNAENAENSDQHPA